ncbi:MAG: Bax inhibitor-1/YccA family protein [Mucilaginibacter polytrichastri]|nr:Bax inhibitor-1/YccA family protein [Mucilaginibacter polytrichastri]
MNNDQLYPHSRHTDISDAQDIQDVEYVHAGSNVRRFMASVFLWMFVALGISAALAYIFASNTQLLGYLVNTETGKLNILGYAAMFSPLAFVLIMSFGLNRLSFTALAGIFLLYSAVMGISMSFILLAYTAGSVVGCFLTASAIFGVMGVAGYTTQMDLTKFGSILMMLLLGVIVATLINYFLHSEQLDYIISYVGVAIFTGLVAYDVQRLKRIGQGMEYGDASTKKLAVMGGLSLYLDFVNLFLFLLRIFGGRRN